MRITRNMMNASARRAKLPISQGSLLDQVNQSKTSSRMAGIFANNRFKGASTTAARNVLGGSYNSMETNADKMKSATDKFLDNTDKGLFAKLKESGKTEDVIKQAKELASAYNDTLENLGTETSVLANFYQKQLRSLAQGNAKELAEAGIIYGKDGKLSVDEAKMKIAEPDVLQKLLGESSGFTKRLSYLSERISDFAESNLKSASSTYGSAGNSYVAFLNSRFNSRG